MAKRLEVYKCEACGNIVEVYHGGPGALVCCDEEMQLLEEKTADKTTEKHVPVIEKIDGGFKVTVGSTLHPMTEEHFIEWIELVADGKVYTEYLKPGQEPVAIFMVEANEVVAREYCNLHGHWKS
ncbi:MULTISPECIES: desulfoferrodoxin [unclassified Fusibacter]|uniref:desulfoferrodoxin n=1 Tax=unclassified Fusibacter TaxID=2624464 RepID=UPI001010886A|nr:MULTISPECIES: desulfoferrodoxin [unclassified Fusibacter]MCK8059255.1 desulfoferrodoxin [Fusibacter sp. A2]NPE21281.1 desulfoferrodoxin [Fusibacter sp. A1]RXV62546.1 desulfoferrodoxin [Fusibacter sp. A1]